MKIFKNIDLTIEIFSLTLFLIIYVNNDYMKSKERKCTIVDKLTTSDGYKHSGNFYLVLKEEQGHVFDIIVSPSTYSQSDVGDIKMFNLRQIDIKQTVKENLIYFFGQVIFGTIGICYLNC